MAPANSAELEAVSGVGDATMQQFGHDILEIVRAVIHGDDDTPDVLRESEPDYTVDEGDTSTDQDTELDSDLDSAMVEDVAELSTKDSLQPSFYWTWRLFCDGYGLAEILQIRRIELATVLNDLQQAQLSGLDVQEDWLESARQEDTSSDAIA